MEAVTRGRNFEIAEHQTLSFGQLRDVNRHDHELDEPTGSFVRRHETALRRYLRFLGASEDRAEDLSQECLMIGVGRESFESRAHERRWLRGVARNLFFKSVDRERFHLHHENIDEAERVWRRFEEAGDGDAYVSALRECLEKLQPRARSAVEFRYRDRLSSAQIGRRLSLRLEGVRTILRRSRAALRQCIEREVSR